jgi:transcriptional regulator with XRE-family HTH domain
MNEEWRGMLMRARKRLKVSRDELAALCHVSASTIRGYEIGRRHPKQESLEAILSALRLERTESNPIRESAGFAPVRSLFDHDEHYYFSVADLDEEVERVAWPQFANNGALEVVAANRAAEALWGIDFRAERQRRAPYEMNVLAVATEFDFPARIENWDEMLRMIVRGFKDPAQRDDVGAPSPYLTRAIEHFSQVNPAFLARLIDAWNAVEYEPARVRWHYAIDWRDAVAGRMHFHAIVSTASERDGLAFNDWIPLDAESWAVLERVKARASRCATDGYLRG